MFFQVIFAADFGAECRNDSEESMNIVFSSRRWGKEVEIKETNTYLSTDPNVHKMSEKNGRIMQSVATALIAMSVKKQA